MRHKKITSPPNSLTINCDRWHGAEDDAIIAGMLKNQTLKLHKLIITNRQPGIGSLCTIPDVLKKTDTLESLELQVQLSLDSIHTISDLLKTNKSLKVLKLTHANINPDRMRILARALEQNSTLTSLDLSYNSIGDGDAPSYIANIFKYNRTLKSVNLSTNWIGFEACRDIVSGLKKNNSLTSLNLCHNQIDDQCMENFNEWLTPNTKLTSLNLASNTFSVFGALNLVSNNTTLTSLDLSSYPDHGDNRNIDGSALIDIYAALTDNDKTKLESLHFTNIHIRQNHRKALLEKMGEHVSKNMFAPPIKLITSDPVFNKEQEELLLVMSKLMTARLCIQSMYNGDMANLIDSEMKKLMLINDQPLPASQ